MFRQFVARGVPICRRVDALIAICSRTTAAFSFAVILAGCGSGPDLGLVHGRVTLDGAPLKDATVIFQPSEGGRPGTAMTNAEGMYELQFNGTRSGATIGRHEVKICTFYPPSQMFNDAGKLVTTPMRPERLPKRYHEQTELTAEVRAGKSTIDFELTSEP